MGDNYKLSVKDTAAIIGVSRSTVMEHIKWFGDLRAKIDSLEERQAAGYHGNLRWRVCSHDVLAFREYSAAELDAMQKYFDDPVDLAYICALQSVEYIDQLSAKLASRNMELKKENAQLEKLNDDSVAAIIKLGEEKTALIQESEGLARKLNESEQNCEKISLKNIDLYSQKTALQSTIATDTERIKDLESYQSILKADLESRDEQIIKLQGYMDDAIKNVNAMQSEIEALEKANAILQKDKAMLHNENHKRGLKIKELLEEIKRLKYVLRETVVAREDWRELYENLRDSQPVSIWQKIAWVFTH